MELALDATSLDTGNHRRDRHLRSAAFFDAEHHPEVRLPYSRSKPTVEELPCTYVSCGSPT